MGNHNVVGNTRDYAIQTESWMDALWYFLKNHNDTNKRPKNHNVYTNVVPRTIMQP
jgi:hypothetical protein